MTNVAKNINVVNTNSNIVVLEGPNKLSKKELREIVGNRQISGQALKNLYKCTKEQATKWIARWDRGMAKTTEPKPQPELSNEEKLDDLLTDLAAERIYNWEDLAQETFDLGQTDNARAMDNVCRLTEQDVWTISQESRLEAAEQLLEDLVVRKQQKLLKEEAKYEDGTGQEWLNSPECKVINTHLRKLEKGIWGRKMGLDKSITETTDVVFVDFDQHLYQQFKLELIADLESATMIDLVYWEDRIDESWANRRITWQQRNELKTMALEPLAILTTRTLFKVVTTTFKGRIVQCKEEIETDRYYKKDINVRNIGWCKEEIGFLDTYNKCKNLYLQGLESPVGEWQTTQRIDVEAMIDIKREITKLMVNFDLTLEQAIANFANEIDDLNEVVEIITNEEAIALIQDEEAMKASLVSEEETTATVHFGMTEEDLQSYNDLF